MSFEDFLTQEKQQDINEIVKAATQASGKKESKVDERFWKPLVDSEKKLGAFVIRFLPAPDPDREPWAHFYDHFFKTPSGKYYINKSLTTFNEPDPVTEHFFKLRNACKTDAEKNSPAIRLFSRKEAFVANILVVKDPGREENEGKVFLYRFPKAVFTLILETMNPPDAEFDDDIKPMNPFSIFSGANLKLIADDRKGGPQLRSYQSSKFMEPEPLFDGDKEKLKELYGNLYSLNEFDQRENFKEYSQLKKEFYDAMGFNKQSETLNMESEEDVFPEASEEKTEEDFFKDILDD